MSRLALISLLAASLLALAGCGPRLTACVWSDVQVQRLALGDFDFSNFDVIVAGNGTTQARLYPVGDTLSIAPLVQSQGNFTNTGGSYVLYRFRNLDAGRYEVRVTGTNASSNRTFNVEPGRELQVQVECP